MMPALNALHGMGLDTAACVACVACSVVVVVVGSECVAVTQTIAKRMNTFISFLITGSPKGEGSLFRYQIDLAL